MLSAPREPIYLASQLASICDVDLKTIHNWCDRAYDNDLKGQLECFRTPGGHLRFRHSSVLRFLNRWGYPIPDALLRDRPHLVLIEADGIRRSKLLKSLELVRPGEEYTTQKLTPTQAASAAVVANQRSVTGSIPPASLNSGSAEPTMGLFCNSRWYVHVWDDPYAALVAIGERAAGGGDIDLAVLALPLADLDPRAWIRTVRSREATSSMRVAVLDAEGAVVPLEIASVADDVVLGSLGVYLEKQSQRLGRGRLEKVGDRAAARKRRVVIAPREPIYVASQVANIWNVDLKTVHNWVERGDIEAFCTPGRHLRFRRRSLLHFLRRYNMDIPEELVPERPRVMVVGTDLEAAQRITSALSTVFDTSVMTDPVAALAEVGSQCSGAGLIDAVVVSFPAAGVNGSRWISALMRHPDTRYTRVVVLSDGDEQRKAWQELGAIAAMQSLATEQVGAMLERALGMAG